MRAAFLIVIITLTVVVSAPAFAWWATKASAPELALASPLQIGKPSSAFWGKHLRSEQIAQPKTVFVDPSPVELSALDNRDPEPVVKVYKLQSNFNPLPRYLGGSSGPRSPGAIPEPASFIALVAGLVGLLIKRGR